MPHKKDDAANLLPNRLREYPSTYFVQDRANRDEMTRLQIADQLITTQMGGVLPEQADLSIFETVLDVGCGTGSWLIELAHTVPTIRRLVGVDISNKMVTFARTLAEAQEVSDRVSFQEMDALRLLDFPTGTFDLVNHRLGLSWLRKWDWPRLLHEYQRVCKPGGIVRVTEVDIAFKSNSPALTQLSTFLVDAFYQAGHLFTKEGNGVMNHVAPLMQQHGLLNVRTHTRTTERKHDANQEQNLEAIRLTYHNAAPFLKKWIRLPEDYEEIFQRMHTEIYQPTFAYTTTMLTAWGTNSALYSSKEPAHLEGESQPERPGK